MLRILFIAVLTVVLIGCNSPQSIKVQDEDKRNSSFAETIDPIIESEKTILSLAPLVSDIARSLTKESSTTKQAVQDLFAPNVLLEQSGETQSIPGHNFLNQLWQPFLGNHEFTECQFGTESGNFFQNKQRFDMETLFEGKIEIDGIQHGVTARQTISWNRINKLWTISSWRQRSFDIQKTPSPMFVDVTSDLVTDPLTLVAVSGSSHQQRTLDAIKRGTVMEPLIEGLPGFNDWESAWQFPSASVVDFDNDGWDDIYLTDRWTGGIMLRNDRGKFRDATKECGLIVNKNTNCMIFADFDNDGDPDAFAGGSIHDSQYFRNDHGVFRLQKDTNGELAYARFVTAGSAADFNGDGLLDLYLSTYVSPSASANPNDWVQRMIIKSDREKFRGLANNHPFIDRGGPANILFINIDGKLTRCETDDVLKQWRNSYQSVWHDWDNDGDPDLYVCNDFAPDAFLRNDTQQGSESPRFLDVTDSVSDASTMGYSMGASWGDFDNDADLDLYVSEMYSKAGKRILQKFPDADKRSVVAAKGNFLFQNDGARFNQVAGSKTDQVNVAKVGWAFGGQFADFDNDGWLDIYCPSGFYTAPELVREDADL